MRRLLSAFFIAIGLSAAGCAYAEPQTPIPPQNPATLAGWVDKSPTTVTVDLSQPGEPPHGNIWDDAKIASAMEKTLGKEGFADVTTGWGTGSLHSFPVQAITDGVAFMGCKPHACAGTQALIFINGKTDIVQACIITSAAGQHTVTWRTPRGATKLASNACQPDVLELQKVLDDYGDKSLKNLTTN